MAGHGAKLDRKQEHAIAALLSEPSVTAAAGSAGVGERTLRRWMQATEFREAYRQARRDAVTAATARLQQAAGAAVDTLKAIAEDAEAPASARVAAARSILDAAFRATELEDLAGQVEELKRDMDGWVKREEEMEQQRNGRRPLWH